ncbi:MAG: hydroxymethylglutaryl-CoA reductase, degradative, partial [Thermoplasmatota archaeon]
MTSERERTSRIPGFHKLAPAERAAHVAHFAHLTSNEQSALQRGLSLDESAGFIENVVGQFSLPLGIATNFIVNGREVLVPMAIEEASVVAAASNAAKAARAAGGFTVTMDSPALMIGP